MSSFELTGRKVLVTGGARGLGAGMATAMAAAGASVMLGDVTKDVGEQTAAAITANGGGKAGFVALDVTDDAQWESAVAHTVAELGGLDVVVNNADRKGGHVLVGGDERVYGVDHGLTLHTEDKLRTVLWGWIGDELRDELLEPLRVLRGKLDGELGEEIGEHVTRREVAALRSRVDRLLNEPRFPEPNGYGPAIPWPAF